MKNDELKYSDFEKSCNKTTKCSDCKFCQDPGKSYASCQAVYDDNFTGCTKGDYIRVSIEHDPNFPNKNGNCKYYEERITKNTKLKKKWFEFWKKS